MGVSKANRTRDMRYKRPALASMGYDTVRDELWKIRDACTDIHWFTDQDDDTLLNALDGEEDEVWEFRMAFSDLEAKADRLEQIIGDYYGWDGSHLRDIYDDCTVALIGERYKILGYDFEEEDYFSLASYDESLAQTEAGKRLMRRTKADMLSTIGQCMGILIAFLDLRQQYDYLKATFDILRDENTSLLQTIKEIDAAYDAIMVVAWHRPQEAVRRFDALLENLPDRAWVE